MREYAEDVLNVRAEFNLGQGGSDSPLNKIEAAAHHWGNVFLGRDNRFDVQQWNTPNQLGMTLTMLFPEETKHYGNPGAAAFMWERRADVHALGYCTPDCIDLGAD